MKEKTIINLNPKIKGSYHRSWAEEENLVLFIGRKR